MEDLPSQNKDMLRNLALLYIALAYNTDQDMDSAEADAIADRLQLWQAEATNETLQQAVGDALQAYTQGGAADPVREAAHAVGETVPQDLRAFILEDLMDIALADDKFLHEENSFIGELASLWEVRSEPEEKPEERKWSILNERTRDTKGWTAIHDLAYIYLTLAHETDSYLSSEELEAIQAKLSEWLPDVDDDEVLPVVKEALRLYVQNPERNVFEDAVESVKQAVPEHQRDAVLEDLRYVAGADEELLEQEQALIDDLAAAWGQSETSR